MARASRLGVALAVIPLRRSELVGTQPDLGNLFSGADV